MAAVCNFRVLENGVSPASTRTVLLPLNLITDLPVHLSKVVRKTQHPHLQTQISLSPETHRGWQEDSQASCPARPRWSVGSSRGPRAYVLTGMSWDPSPLSSHGRTRTRTMKRRTKRNESHPHKTVICKMCVTRRSGEGIRKRPMTQQQASELTQCCLSLPRSASSPSSWAPAGKGYAAEVR